jgi:hypothetical protein
MSINRVFLLRPPHNFETVMLGFEYQIVTDYGQLSFTAIGIRRLKRLLDKAGIDDSLPEDDNPSEGVIDALAT